MEDEFYEAMRRSEWFIDGLGKTGLSVELFTNLSSEKICEIYNVEISFFKPDELCAD